MILFYWLVLFCTTSLFAENSVKLPREYYTPGDLDGFSLAPSNPIISIEAEKKSPRAAMALEVEAINRRAFVHLRRREAIPVDDENFQLTQDARVYSPSRGMAVIHAADHFSMLLFPKTSIEAKKNQERWLFTVHEEQGNLRISTLQDGLILKFEAVQSSELWSSLDLYIAPGSDILIHKQPSLLQTWLIRGQAHLIFSKKFGLHSQRADSLLSELQNAQIHDLEPARKQVDLFSGQELQLGVESELTIKITLPSPQLWQDKLLKSSPLLAENIQTSKRSIQKVQNIRVKVLENWLKDQSIDATTIPSLLQQQRWEEAYYLLQKAKASQKEGLSPTMQTQEMLCLLRLQQDQRLKTYSTADALLQTEKLRILLRRHAANEIIEKTFERDSLSSVDSVYLMAIAHQQKKSWRIAGDYWELWPGSDEDLTLERSRHEWLENLDQEKPWSWQAQMSLGQDSNPLHIPPKTAAAPEYGHRSNNVFRTRQKLQYLFDRQNTFSVRGEMLLDAQFYQS
ncbi:MAG: hypothetical protein NTX25_17525, partial [Proteobacteria bacterium]|nr:hypothetical protein [Pseudomonadota bacterium]